MQVPRTFVRDPGGRLVDHEASEAFDPDARLPSAAVDTGFRQAGVELWMRSSAEDRFVYPVDHEGGVEAWPQVADVPGCA